MSDYIAGLGGLGTYVGGSLINTAATTNITAGSTSNVIYLQGIYSQQEPARPPVEPLMPDDVVTWLRQRVAEMCWQ